MLRLSLCAALAAVLIGPAYAQSTLCDAVRQTIEDTTPFSPFETAVCQTSRDLGGHISDHCALAYDYRTPAARLQFDELTTILSGCFDSLPVEAGVNHPDSYDLRQFRHGTSTISLSLKDKGALAQSFVFLRVTRP